jgi:hypothetical protein
MRKSVLLAVAGVTLAGAIGSADPAVAYLVQYGGNNYDVNFISGTLFDSDVFKVLTDEKNLLWRNQKLAEQLYSLQTGCYQGGGGICEPVLNFFPNRGQTEDFGCSFEGVCREDGSNVGPLYLYDAFNDDNGKSIGKYVAVVERYSLRTFLQGGVRQFVARYTQYLWGSFSYQIDDVRVQPSIWAYAYAVSGGGTGGTGNGGTGGTGGTGDTTAVPEPLTILGSITAAGFGVAFKRKKNNKPT